LGEEWNLTKTHEINEVGTGGGNPYKERGGAFPKTKRKKKKNENKGQPSLDLMETWGGPRGRTQISADTAAQELLNRKKNNSTEKKRRKTMRGSKP